MSATTNASLQRLKVETTADGLQVWLHAIHPPGLPPLTKDEILRELEQAQIVVDSDVNQRIDNFIALLDAGGKVPDQFLIAEGRSPAEAREGALLWHDSLRPAGALPDKNQRVDHYSFNTACCVEKDGCIGTLVGPVQSAAGGDVFGATIAPRGTFKAVQLDKSVRLGDDGKTVFANRAGMVVYDGHTLSVRDVFVVKGDVNFETGNINSTVPVEVGGAVRDCFSVISQKSVFVGGAVEAAVVNAKGDVVVKGGVVHRHKGSIQCGGSISARFCDGAGLRAVGDVVIETEIVDSRIHCMKKLLAPRGSLMGGRTYAREGIEIATLGSEAGVATHVAVGVDPAVIREVDRVRRDLYAKRRDIERTRQSVLPLMSNVRRLTAAQRERATELLFQAAESEAEITNAEQRYNEMLEQSRSAEVPYVLVSTILHCGVVIYVGHRKAIIQKALRGPIRVEKRKVRNVSEFVAVNGLSGSVAVLPSVPFASPGEDEANEAVLAGEPAAHGSGG